MSWTRQLWVRLLGAQLAVVLLAGTTVALVTLAATPQIAARQMDHLGPMLHGMLAMPGHGRMMTALDETLARAFQDATFLALLAGGSVGLVTAILTSVIVSRHLAAPIRRAAAIARGIGDGHLGDRAPSSGIVEIDQLTCSINTMAEALERAERHRVELIADVAHELRTPLATITGYLEGLADGVIASDHATWTLLLGEAGRLNRLVGDLSELSRAEAGDLRLTIRETSVEEIVVAAIRRVERDATAAGIGIERVDADSVPTVAADLDRAVQVVTNLLSNAVRYSRPGGSVRVVTSRAGHGVRIAVEDDGIGIAPADLPRVFERFYRVDPSRSRQHGGAGVGLTIARALAIAMGGTLTASSPGLGRGSTFTLWLPAAQGSAPVSPQPRAQPLLRPGQGDRQPSPTRRSSKRAQSSAESGG